MKKVGKTAIFIMAVVFVSVMFASCSATDIRDFQDGFRQGWNSTAPEHLRY